MTSPEPLDDTDLTRLQTLLDALPAPLQPMDVSALDGYLCGVLLQPRPVPAARWLPQVTDVDARPARASAELDELQALVRRRHAELDAAIGERQWFDPWIYPPESDQSNESGPAPGDSMLPWVAGFAAAMEVFPELMAMDNAELVEPMALLFMHFDPEDLEDADALIAVIETLEPPTDLAEAVQDAVRALMLMADVTRPRASPPQPAARPALRRRMPIRSNPRRPR